MGKSYYCEFCDKAFRDNGTNRKNHLRSGNHQRSRREHYESFKDIATLLADETLKKPCQTFLKRGHCDFGERCRFSHMTPKRKAALERQVIAQKEKKAAAAEQSAEDLGPKLDRWLVNISRKYGKDVKDTTTEDLKTDELDFSTQYRLPPVLQGISNLPPSVLPPSGQSTNLSYEDWG